MLKNLKKCQLCLVALSLVMIFLSCENTNDSNETKQLVVNDAVPEDNSGDLNVEKKETKPARTIILSIGDWEPFTSSRAKYANITEIMVKEAFAFENIDVKYEYPGWKTSYDNVKSGISLGTFPWSKNEDREKEFYLSKEPLIFEKTVFFHLNELDFDWNELSDLKNYKIGGTVGYNDVKLLEGAGLTVDAVENEDSNYKKILSREIDLYPGSFLVGFYHINKFFDPSETSLFTTHPRPLMQKQYYILFSRTNPLGKEMSEIFDRGIRKLTASGRYDEIYENTILKMRSMKDVE